MASTAFNLTGGSNVRAILASHCYAIHTTDVPMRTTFIDHSILRDNGDGTFTVLQNANIRVVALCGFTRAWDNPVTVTLKFKRNSTEDVIWTDTANDGGQYSPSVRSGIETKQYSVSAGTVIQFTFSTSFSYNTTMSASCVITLE